MKNKKKLINTLLLFLLVIGLGYSSDKSFAEKKATEGQNEADVEFYAPTPKKEEVKSPKTKISDKKELSPVSRMLPKTGENKTSNLMIFLGLSLVVLVFSFKRKKVGEMNGN